MYLRRDFRAKPCFACTVATKAFALPRSRSLGRQKPSCCHSKSPTSSATGGVGDFSLSTREVFLACSNLPLSANEKSHPIGWLSWRRRRDFRTKSRATLLALLQLRLLLSLARGRSVGKSQVAATRKASLPLALRAVGFSPSLTATRFSPSNLHSPQ